MNGRQLGILIGARLTLLVGAIALFVVGVIFYSGVGNLLIVASFVVAILYFYLHFRTRRMIKRLVKESKDGNSA